jgi:hypothetical protein
MSVLAYPRLHFKGKCLINPATGNNNDVAVNIDTVNVSLLPALSDMPPKEALEWMISGIQAVNPINQKTCWYLRCSWNYFGNLSVEFVDAAITAVVGSDGRVCTDDPMIGRPIKLLGTPLRFHRFSPPTPVICDLDPLGTGLTQIFVGGLSLGDRVFGLSASQDARAFVRWPAWRNASTYQGEHTYPGAGATWQFEIPRKALGFHSPSSSPILTELEETVGASQGIVVQFCFYLVEPGITDVELIWLFQNKQWRHNPAEALMVGTVGVWEDDELASVLGERLLLLPPAQEQPPPGVLSSAAGILGPVAARVQPGRNVVSLNLITTFPDADYQRPPLKADLGRVLLGFIPSSCPYPIPISAPLPYDSTSYELTAGVVDVPYDPSLASPDQLEQGTLVLLADPTPKAPICIILTEAHSSITIEIDDRATYCDVGDCCTISILVRDRGLPPGEDVIVSLWEYQFVTCPGGFQQLPPSRLTLVEDGPPLQHRISFPEKVVFPAGRDKTFPIPFQALRPGALALAFTLDGKPLKGDYPWDTAFYAGVRVRPDDNFDSIPRETRLSWEFMYETVFKYYHLIYPAMSQHIRFNNQAAMENAAGDLVDRTDWDHWSSTHYMPITRDLSVGKRALIVEWAEDVARRRRQKDAPA